MSIISDANMHDIVTLTEKASDINTKYVKMKKELEKLEDEKYDIHYALFYAHLARANSIIDNEENMNEFIDYIITDFDNTLQCMLPNKILKNELLNIFKKWMTKTTCVKLIKKLKDISLVIDYSDYPLCNNYIR